MTPYSIDSDIRLTAALVLTLLASVVAAKLASFVNLYIVPPSVFMVFAALYKVFDCYAWRWPIIRDLHGIPYIGGKWKGNNIWEVSDGSARKESEVTVKVEQTWSKIRFDVKSKKAKSYVRCASVFDTGSSRKRFLFVYDLEFREKGGVSMRMDGCQALDLDTYELRGPYFNAQHKQGELVLTQIKD
ncbi:MAG: Cap15 family cyclic dinucleotide receptor domain-containing protein [Syntrophales bacterium]